MEFNLNGWKVVSDDIADEDGFGYVKVIHHDKEICSTGVLDFKAWFEIFCSLVKEVEGLPFDQLPLNLNIGENKLIYLKVLRRQMVLKRLENGS